MAIKQSVCLPIYKSGLRNSDFLKEIKTIGFDAVELWMRDENFDEICDLTKEYDLALCSMIGHSSLPDGLNNPTNHSRIVDEIAESVEIAAANGIRGLICFSGNRREGVAEEEGKSATIEGLKKAASFAEEKGVLLNLELLNSKIDHIGYECDSTAWGVDVVAKTGSTHVKLLYDIYHMQIMEGDIIRTISENIDSIGHFHTAGNPGRHEMDDNQELNYRGICGAISSLDYDGFVGHEFNPKGDALESLSAAFTICNV